MQIGKVEIRGGQVNFADKINKIVYTENNHYTKEQFEKVKTGLQELSPEKIAELETDAQQARDAKNDEEKKTWGEKMKEKLLQFGVTVVERMTGTVVSELLMRIFWGG